MNKDSRERRNEEPLEYEFVEAEEVELVDAPPTIPAPPPAFEAEEQDDARRVGRALAKIDHLHMWKRAGFHCMGDYVEALGVDASVVRMVRVVFPDPTPARVQPESASCVRARERGFPASGRWVRRSFGPSPSTTNTFRPGSPGRDGREGALRGSGFDGFNDDGESNEGAETMKTRKTNVARTRGGR